MLLLTLSCKEEVYYHPLPSVPLVKVEEFELVESIPPFCHFPERNESRTDQVQGHVILPARSASEIRVDSVVCAAFIWGAAN